MQLRPGDIVKDPKRVDILGRYAIAVLAIGFTLLVSHHVVKPLLADMRNLRAVNEALEVLSSGEEDLQTLDTQVALAADQIAESGARLPTTLNLDAFLGRLGDIGKQTQVRVENVTPRAMVEHPLYREMRLDIRLHGSFVALYDFLREIEESGQLARVEELKIVGSAGQGRCSADLQLALYFAPEGRG